MADIARWLTPITDPGSMLVDDRIGPRHLFGSTVMRPFGLGDSGEFAVRAGRESLNVFRRDQWFVADGALSADFVVVLTPQAAIFGRAASSDMNRRVLRYPARNLPFSLSMNAISVGVPFGRRLDAALLALWSDR